MFHSQIANKKLWCVVLWPKLFVHHTVKPLSLIQLHKFVTQIMNLCSVCGQHIQNYTLLISSFSKYYDAHLNCSCFAIVLIAFVRWNPFAICLPAKSKINMHESKMTTIHVSNVWWCVPSRYYRLPMCVYSSNNDIHKKKIIVSTTKQPYVFNNGVRLNASWHEVDCKL